jgi:Zn-dependent M28 family amino/carboxypeptidase
VVVVGAHYDTKDMKGFVGAEDGAGGTAILTQLARSVRPRELRSTIVFIAFDGEEAPAGTPDSEFERFGLRGSKVAAERYGGARAMLLLDFVGQKGLRIPQEESSDSALWAKLRASAGRAGVGRVFPPGTQGAILDDHTPFQAKGVPSIDLIDFDYGCFHRTCDDLSQISPRSLDAVGETVVSLLPRL